MTLYEQRHDTTALFEQLQWAIKQDILDGKSAESQLEAQKIHNILKEALTNAYDDGFEEARWEFQTG